MEQWRFDVLAGAALLVGTNLLLLAFGPGALARPQVLLGYLAPTAAGFLFLAAGTDAGPARPHVLRGAGMVCLGISFLAGALSTRDTAVVAASVLGALAAGLAGVATALGYGETDAGPDVDLEPPP